MRKRPESPSGKTEKESCFYRPRRIFPSEGFIFGAFCSGCVWFEKTKAGKIRFVFFQSIIFKPGPISPEKEMKTGKMLFRDREKCVIIL